MFKKKLQDTVAIERTDAVFEVEVTDPNAPVIFFHKGEEVKPNDTCLVEKYGKGQFRLTFKNCNVQDDEGEIKVITVFAWCEIWYSFNWLNNSFVVVYTLIILFPQAVSGSIECCCQLTVGEGEKAPVIKPNEPIEGPVTRPLQFEVPYVGELLCKTIENIVKVVIHAVHIVNSIIIILVFLFPNIFSYFS